MKMFNEALTIEIFQSYLLKKGIQPKKDLGSNGDLYVELFFESLQQAIQDEEEKERQDSIKDDEKFNDLDDLSSAELGVNDQIWEFLINSVRLSYFNRLKLAKKNINNCLLEFMEDTASTKSIENLINLLEICGEFSFNSSDNEKLLNMLSIEKKGWSCYSKSLLKCLNSFLKGSLIQPSSFFHHGNATSAKGGIEAPPLRRFPGYGFTFSTWMRLESPDVISNDNDSNPCLFSFCTKEGQKFSSIINNKQFLVLTSANMSTLVHSESVEFNLFRIPFFEWFSISIVHARGRFMKRSQVHLYINGRLVQTVPLKYPSFSNTISGCSLMRGISGQNNTVYFFGEPLSSGEIAAVYNLGPNYGASFNDPNGLDFPLCTDVKSLVFSNKLESSLIFGYNPQACEKRSCLNVASIPDPLNSWFVHVPHATVLPGTLPWCNSTPQENLTVCGGAMVLLPLFQQIESPMVSNDKTRVIYTKDGQNLDELLELLKNITTYSYHYQHEVLQLNGFMIIGYLLERVLPSRISQCSLMSLLDLGRSLLRQTVLDPKPTSKRLVSQLYRQILSQGILWLYTNEDLQIRLYSELATDVAPLSSTGQSFLLSTILSIPRFFDCLRECYLLKDDSGNTVVKHPITGEEVGKKPGTKQLYRIRSFLLLLIKHLFMSLGTKVNFEDTKSLMDFLIDYCEETKEIVDILELLLFLVHDPKQKNTALMEHLRQLQFPVLLIRILKTNDSDEVSVYCIKILGCYVAHLHSKDLSDLPVDVLHSFSMQVKLSPKVYNAIYEFMTNQVSTQIVEGDVDRSSQCFIRHSQGVNLLMRLLLTNKKHFSIALRDQNQIESHDFVPQPHRSPELLRKGDVQDDQVTVLHSGISESDLGYTDDLGTSIESRSSTKSRNAQYGTRSQTTSTESYSVDFENLENFEFERERKTGQFYASYTSALKMTQRALRDMTSFCNFDPKNTNVLIKCDSLSNFLVSILRYVLLDLSSLQIQFNENETELERFFSEQDIALGDTHTDKSFAFKKVVKSPPSKRKLYGMLIDIVQEISELLKTLIYYSLKTEKEGWQFWRTTLCSILQRQLLLPRKVTTKLTETIETSNLDLSTGETETWALNETGNNEQDRVPVAADSSAQMSHFQIMLLCRIISSFDDDITTWRLNHKGVALSEDKTNGVLIINMLCVIVPAMLDIVSFDMMTAEGDLVAEAHDISALQRLSILQRTMNVIDPIVFGSLIDLKPCETKLALQPGEILKVCLHAVCISNRYNRRNLGLRAKSMTSDELYILSRHYLVHHNEFVTFAPPAFTETLSEKEMKAEVVSEKDVLRLKAVVYRNSDEDLPTTHRILLVVLFFISRFIKDAYEETLAYEISNGSLGDLEKSINKRFNLALDLLRSLVQDFQGFIKKKVLNRIQEPFWQSNGNNVALAMFLCSVEWQNAMVKSCSPAAVSVFSALVALQSNIRKSYGELYESNLLTSRTEENKKVQQHMSLRFEDELQIRIEELKNRKRHEDAYCRRLWFHITDRLRCSKEVLHKESDQLNFWKLDMHEDGKMRRIRFVRDFHGSTHPEATLNKSEDSSNKLENENLSGPTYPVLKNVSLRLNRDSSDSIYETNNTKFALDELYRVEENDDDPLKKIIEDQSEKGFSSIFRKKSITVECHILTPGLFAKGQMRLLPTQLSFVVDDNQTTADDGYRSYIDSIGGTLKYSDISYVSAKRYMLRHTALEIFLVDKTAMFFNFNDTDTLLQVMEILPTGTEGLNRAGIFSLKPNLRTAPELFQKWNMTKKWKAKEITNFDYLMAINWMAGRTYNDLNQYPVFPWILKDYVSSTIDLGDPSIYRDLSKPVGCLNDRRLEQFEERYATWDDPDIPAFHYGSHYSTAGYTLYWLIRIEPFTTLFLKLQSGKFDHPSRMFSSMARAWLNCQHSTSDVKELIPELFYLPEIFINTNNFSFGLLEDGKEISNVELPPWCHNDPYLFIRINRMALESDYVSAHLHQWIDLIFGSKQQGPEAIAAKNVFYYLTYEGSVDLGSIVDPVLRTAVEQQISSFGQTPSRLLFSPHPPRFAEMGNLAENNVSEKVTTATEMNAQISSSPVVLISSFDFNSNDGNNVDSSVNTTVLTISGSRCFALQKLVYPKQNTTKKKFKSVKTLSGNDLSENGERNKRSKENNRKSDDNIKKSFESNASGDKSNSDGCLPSNSSSPRQIRPKSPEIPKPYMIVDQNLRRDEFSLLKSFEESSSAQFSVSFTFGGSSVIWGCGYWDKSFRGFSIEGSQSRCVQSVFYHCDVLTCIDVSNDNKLLVTGSLDTNVIVWKINQETGLVEPLPKCIIYDHSSSISCVAVHADLDLVASHSKDKLLLHTASGLLLRNIVHPTFTCGELLSITCDGLIVATYSNKERDTSAIAVYTINGYLLRSSLTDENLTTLNVTKDGNFIITAGSSCCVVIRVTHTLGMIHVYDSQPSPINCLHLPKHEEYVMLGLHNGSVSLHNTHFQYWLKMASNAITCHRP